MKTKITVEQPRVEFLQKQILILEDSSGSERIWTSNGQFNDLIPQSRLFFPALHMEAYSDVTDQYSVNNYNLGDDRKVDTFKFKYSVPMEPTQSVHGMQLLQFYRITMVW